MDLSFIASQELQQAIANVLLAFAVGAAGAISKAVYTFLKTNTSANQFAILEQIAASAANAAEQGALAGFVNDKKATALAIVNEGLKNAGITNLSAEQIDAAVEAAVMENFNSTTTSATVTAPDGTVAEATIETDNPESDTDTV